MLPWRPRVVNNFFSVLFLERFLPRPISRKSPLSAIAVEEKKSRRRTLSRGLWEREEATFFPKYFLGQKKRGGGGEGGKRNGANLSPSLPLSGGRRERERDRPPFAKHGLCSFSMNYGQRQLLFGGNERGKKARSQKKGGKSGTLTSVDAIFAQKKRSPSLPLPFHLYREPNVISIFFPENPPSREGGVTRAMTTGDFERRGG